MILVGRAVFGMGAESMYVGQSTLVSEWFINFEFPLAIAMISCIPLFGSLLNGAVTPGIYANESEGYRGAFGTCFLIGFFMQVASLVMVICIVCLDLSAEKTDKMILTQYK